jgi:hypothetical protein
MTLFSEIQAGQSEKRLSLRPEIENSGYGLVAQLDRATAF